MRSEGLYKSVRKEKEKEKNNVVAPNRKDNGMR